MPPSATFVTDSGWVVIVGLVTPAPLLDDEELEDVDPEELDELEDDEPLELLPEPLDPLPDELLEEPDELLLEVATY